MLRGPVRLSSDRASRAELQHALASKVPQLAGLVGTLSELLGHGLRMGKDELLKGLTAGIRDRLELESTQDLSNLGEAALEAKRANLQSSLDRNKLNDGGTKALVALEAIKREQQRRQAGGNTFLQQVCTCLRFCSCAAGVCGALRPKLKLACLCRQP